MTLDEVIADMRTVAAQARVDADVCRRFDGDEDAACWFDTEAQQATRWADQLQAIADELDARYEDMTLP